MPPPIVRPIRRRSPFVGAPFAGPAARPPAGNLRRAVAAALRAAPDVAAVVGAKVYPLRPPEAQPHPWVVYQVADDDRRESLDGPTGSALAVVRVGCGSRDYADCDALATAVRALLDGFSGSLGGLVAVEACVSDGEEDSYAAPEDSTDRGVFWTVLDYRVLYREN